MDVLGPLARFADWYDGVSAQSIKEWDYVYDETNRIVGQRHGKDSLQATTWLVMSSTMYGLYRASQFVATGMLDTLRVGRGFSQGTVGGAATDALRLLSVFGAATRFGIKYVPPLLAKALAGTKYERACGPTAVAFASRMSATRLWLTLEGVRKILKLPLSPKDPKFPGVKVEDVGRALQEVGAKVSRSVPTTLKQAAAPVEANQGTVVFTLKWKVGKVLDAHTMTAFKDGGRVMIADQHGIWTVEAIEKAIASKGATFVEALLVEDSMFVPTAQQAAGAVAAAALLSASSNLAWLEPSLHVAAWQVPGPMLTGLAALARDKVRGGGLSANATLVLNALPPSPGSRDALMLQVGAGISNPDAFVAAVEELEEMKRVYVTRRGAGPMDFTVGRM